jgi:hypothetical protein
MLALLVSGAGAAGGQQEEPIPSELGTTEPVEGSPDAPLTSLPPVPEGQEGPATSLPGGPGTTVADCQPFPPPAIVFVGRVTANADPDVTFAVEQVRQGTPEGSTVAVRYVDDARFLKVGERYLVSASVDAESEVLASKVRRPRGEELPEACIVKDLVVTRHADGTKIDTGVLAGMKGQWGRAALLVLAPAAAVFGVLLALVIVKHLILFGVRLPGRLQAWRRRHPPPHEDPGAPPLAPARVRRTRTRIEQTARR